MRALALILVLMGVLSQSAPPQDADEQYAYVAALAEKGLHERVIREAQTFLRDNPRHEKADLVRYRLACAFFESGREADARAPFEELAVRAGFEFAAEVQFRLGQCLANAGERAKAQACFQRVLAAGKDYLRAPALALLAQAELADGDATKALAHFEQLLERDAKSTFAADARSGRAWCLYRLGRLEAATAAVREALSAPRQSTEQGVGGDDARAAELQFLLGECLLDQKQPKEALAAYASVREGPYADAAVRGAGFAKSALGDARGAAEEFARVLERFPQSRHRAECALQRGIALFQAGDLAPAIAALSVPELEASPEALAWRARAELQSGDAAAALRSVERAQAGKPSQELNERLALQRADLLGKLGRTEEAQRAYERVGSERALLAAAVAAVDGQRWNDAIDLAARLLERFPQSEQRVDALLALGEGLFGAQRWSDAEESFDAAASAERDELRRARAATRAAWAAYLGGEHARAARRFDAVAQLARENADGPNAKRAQALRELPEVEESAYMAARSREDAGDVAGARNAYASALERFPRGPHADEASLRAALLAGDGAGLDALSELTQRGTPAQRARASFELGERLSNAESHAEALRAYQDVLRSKEAGPLAPRASYGAAWCLYRLHKPDEAEVVLERLLDDTQLTPLVADAARELAVWTALERKDLAAAQQRLSDFAIATPAASSAASALAAQTLAAPPAAHRGETRSVDAAPNDRGQASGARDERLATLLRAVVSALCGADRNDEARACLERVGSRLREPRARALVQLEGARLAARSGDADGAERRLAELRDSLGDEPAFAQALFEIGEARFEKGADAQAIALYDEVAERTRAATRGERNTVAASAPLEASALYKAGFARLRAGDVAGAERSFAALVERHEKSELFHESLFLLGEARFRAGRIDPAIECLERVRREAPRHAVAPKVLFRLGLCYGRRERWRECSEALEALARGWKDFPNLAEAELWRGRSAAAQDDPRGARAAFERVLALDKGLLAAQAHLEIGRVLHTAGDRDGALSEFLKVSVLYAGDEEVAEALVLAGQVLEEQDQQEQARAQYREALEKHPKARYSAEARRRLAALGSTR